MKKLNLKSLVIQNFATFENQEINFNHNFNAIVGETGSGKSLILDALQLVFGARADRKIVRKNTEFASVEAEFFAEGDELKDFFDSIGHPFESDQIIVKRLIYANGKSRSFINFQSCSLSTLTVFSRRFIDLVGQFENQKLLSEDYQLVLLDNYAKNDKLVNKYTAAYQEVCNLTKKINELAQIQKEREQREDYLKFQLNEIEALNPSISDEQELLQSKEFILNSEKRKEVFSHAIQCLSENEYGSALGLLSQTISSLEKNSNLVSTELLEKLHTANQLVEEVSFELSKEIDTDYSDENINDVLDRLDLYQRLKRKFGGSIETLMENFESISNELSNLEQNDELIIKLRQELIKKENDAKKLAEELSTTRSKFATKLANEITSSIRSLNMNGASINISVDKNSELGPKGIDRITFMAETNHGEGFFKIKDIASGGELSRILLSVRQILSSTDSISVFLFDEIDTGIGGETAVCTGKALKTVSKSSQVIAITHLPQIAYFADRLINVTKHTVSLDDEIRTHSKIIEISDEKQMAEFIKKMTPIEV